jgi:hypothetical protein
MLEAGLSSLHQKGDFKCQSSAKINSIGGEVRGIVEGGA